MDIAQKTLAVVIPVYKSVNQLANTVSELVQILENSKELEEMGYKLNKVILVDDGMATGRTVLHTVHLLRKYKPKKIVLAVPVASSSAVDLLQDNIDELIVLNIASDFHAVGFYYEDFTEVTDSEVCRLLDDL